MWAKFHQLAAPSAMCLCLLSFGCAATTESAGRMLGKLTGKKTPEQMLNIKTPADRAKEIIELGETADEKSPAEKDRVVAELAGEIQHEEDAGMRRHIFALWRRTARRCRWPS